MDLLATYRDLEWDIDMFLSHTQRIAESLANTAAELGSTQNLSNDDYADIYQLTLETDELAKSIVDKLTDLSGLEEEANPNLMEKMVRKIVVTEKDLEARFKPAFEHFQKLHRQVMEKQRVQIASLRSSMAQSVIQDEPESPESAQCIVHIVPDGQRRPASEVMIDDIQSPTNEEEVQLLHGAQVQYLRSGSDAQLQLDLMRMKHRDLQTLESRAVDLHDIQSKLAVLVKKHGEQIDTVETNIQDTEVRTEKATEQVAQAEVKKHQATRKKVICILIIVIAAILLILILGTSIYYKLFGGS